MKKKLSRVVVMLMALMLIVYITCTTGAINADAEGISVVVDGTTLKTGYYYYDTTQVLTYVTEAPEAAVTDSYAYYDESAGKMTVYGDFDIYMTKSGVPGLQIDNGTLILSGAGNLSIFPQSGIAGNGAETIVSTTGAGIVTEGYKGDIMLNAINYSAIKGLSTVDLETNGDINISTNFKNGIVVDAGNVALVGKSVYLGNSSSQAEGLIKATGDISIVSSENFGENTTSTNYTGAMFEGSNINLKSIDGEVSFAARKNGNIAKGDLTVTATTGVILNSDGNVVNGSLTINSNDPIDINISSGAGSAVTGDFNVNAESSDVNVEATLYTVGGDIDITARSAKLLSKDGYVCGGNVDACVSQGLTINGRGDAIKGYAKIINNGSGSAKKVYINSAIGTAVGGNLDIESAYVSITSGKVTVKGNISITDASQVIIASDTDSVCLGDVNVDASKNLQLWGDGEASVIKGTLTVNQYADINLVARTNSGGKVPETPILANLPSSGVVVLQEKDTDTGVAKTYVCVEGVLYAADASTCEHPLVDGEGECLVCYTDNLDVAGLVKGDGTTTTYSSLADAISDAADGETVKLLYNIKQPDLDLDHYNELPNKKITLDLSGYRLQMGEIDTENALTIMNGTFYGAINHASDTGKLTFKDVKGTIKRLQWMPDDGVSLINSQLTFSGTQFWLEKLDMDEQSVFDISILSGSGLSNYGRISDIENALGGIEEFLPYGYTVAKKRPSPNAADIRNTIFDENGNLANNILLKYKRITDDEFTVAFNPAAYVYDGTAKTPEVTVSYNGTALTKGVHYNVTYLNNVNAGQAGVKIQGIGVYHDSVDKSFVIDKAPQNAPTGIKAVSETEDGKNDGSIIYVTAAMEYSTDQTNYKAISSNSINGLADGDYYIRYKETANYYASPAAKVTVHKGTTVVAKDTEATTPTSQGNDNASPDNQTTGNQNGVNTGDSFPMGICLVLIMMTGCLIPIVYRELKKNR